MIQPSVSRERLGYERLRPRVMVVDDDPVVGCVLAGALNRGGCDVEIFSSSTEALKAFDQLAIDLAVIDWVMPGLDGLSLAGALKTRSPHLPAMLITSHGEHEDIRAARADGRFAAVLDKPLDLKHFMSAVQSCLSEPPAPRKAPDFEGLLAGLVEAVVMVDGQGRVVYRNCAAGRMFGLAEDFAGPLLLSGLFPAGSPTPDSLAKYCRPNAAPAKRNEGLFQRRGGERFFAAYSASPIQVEGGEWNAALVIRDTKPYQKALRDYEKKRDMETLALTDSLTGLYNRRYFDRRLGEELKRAERYGSPLALIMIDFDHFKEVNDLFGHLVGDEVLVTASRILSRGLRDVDALVRWGGEEFMIIMPETGVETSLKAAVRLHALIGEAQEWRSLAPGLAVTVSMGLVNIPWAEGPLSANQVLSMLDQALYKAKNNGRNQIIRYIAERDAFERV